MHWAIWDAMFKAQNAFEGVISNFPNRVIAALLRRDRVPARAARTSCRPIALGHDVASLLIAPSADARPADGRHVHRPDDDDDPVRLIERALAATMAAEPIEAKLKRRDRKRALSTALAPGAGIDVLAERAVAAGVITADEARMLAAHRELVAQVIAVDDFDRDLGASLLASPRHRGAATAIGERQRAPAEARHRRG